METNTTTTTKERPILFSTEMVQAILQGRKTMTRRIIKLRDKSLPGDDCIQYAEDGAAMGVCDFSKTFPYWQELKCPYGMLGDVLWVREAFSDDLVADGEGERMYVFKADFPDLKGCKPSIHMRKKYARIFLEITEIRVERLLAITEADAEAEGVERLPGGCFLAYCKHKGSYTFARDSFLSLWDSINGYKAHAHNPWVWVLSFKTELSF